MLVTIAKIGGVVATAAVSYSLGRIHGNNWMLRQVNKNIVDTFKPSLKEACADYESACGDLGELHSRSGEYANLSDEDYAEKNRELMNKCSGLRSSMAAYQRIVNTASGVAV